MFQGDLCSDYGNMDDQDNARDASGLDHSGDATSPLNSTRNIHEESIDIYGDLSLESSPALKNSSMGQFAEDRMQGALKNQPAVDAVAGGDIADQRRSRQLSAVEESLDLDLYTDMISSDHNAAKQSYNQVSELFSQVVSFRSYFYLQPKCC